MIASQIQMQMVSGEVRQIEIGMWSVIDELTTHHNWAGTDADRFRSEWLEQVNLPLRRAVDILEGLTFKDVGEFLGEIL